MSKMSNYLENKLIDEVLRGVNYTPPATIYIALFTSDPTDAGTGNEILGGGYARQPVTFGAPNNGSTTNSIDVVFPVATSNWGTITHIGIYDALTSGNLLFHGALNTARTINIDSQLVILSGDLTVTLD